MVAVLGRGGIIISTLKADHTNHGKTASATELLIGTIIGTIEQQLDLTQIDSLRISSLTSDLAKYCI